MRTVYVFNDQDHGDIEVCSTLALAKAKGWPEDEEWEEATSTSWMRGEYCFIYECEIET